MLLTCASKDQNQLAVTAGALNAAGISAGVLSGMFVILLLLLSPHVASARPRVAPSCLLSQTALSYVEAA